MWSEQFKEHIRKQKIKQKDLYPLMGITKKTFITNLEKNSMRIEHILKVYELYNWDLNELKEGESNIINEKPELYQKPVQGNSNYTFELKEIKNLYEKLLEGKDKEINYLRKQLDKFIKNNSALEGGATRSA